MTAVAEAEGNQMKREATLLNLICYAGVLGLLAFVAYNLLTAGNIISTDGLFFTVVPLVLALCFLAVPAGSFLAGFLEKRRLKEGGQPTGETARSASLPARTTTPALKDARGREVPPDVARMVAQMKTPASKPE